MPAARAASSREAPSSTSARASIRRAARASRHRPASRRSSTAPSSFRVIAIVIAPPDRRPTTAARRARRHELERSEGRALGIMAAERLGASVDPGVRGKRAIEQLYTAAPAGRS